MWFRLVEERNAKTKAKKILIWKADKTKKNLKNIWNENTIKKKEFSA